MVSLLGEKFIFLELPWDNKISTISKLSVYTHVLLINFPEQFELYFYFKYSRSYKVYNLGNKTFETDFSYTQFLSNSPIR